MPEARLTSGELRTALARPPAFLPASAHYRLHLALVVAGMLGVQLAYVALVAGIALIAFLGIAVSWRGVPPNFFTATFLLGFASAGVIAVLFLLKPLLVRRERPRPPLEILAQHEPLLFDLVSRICALLGAPQPSRIFAHTDVNASATVPGWRGMLLGRYDLTLGLPLATSLTLPEFIGVLAHEMGHFSQRTGLRSWVLIERIRAWFHRVVNERDRFDAWLDRLCLRPDFRAKAIGGFARLLVRASRWFLSRLLFIAGRIGSAFSRQMEFDADRHQAAIVGAETVVRTLERLAELRAASTVASMWMSQAFGMGLVPDDYMELIREGEAAIARGDVSVESGPVESDPMDTHPADAERIAAVRAGPLRIALELDAPASRLFDDLPGMCRRVTLDVCNRVFDDKIKYRNLAPARDVVAVLQSFREEHSATVEAFGPGADFSARWFVLNEPYDKTSRTSPPDWDRFAAAERKNLLHYSALSFVRNGVGVNPAAFELRDAGRAAIEAEEERSRRELAEIVASFRAVTASIAAWLDGLRSGGLAPELEPAWAACAALSEYQEAMYEIRRFRAVAVLVRGNIRLFRAASSANLLDKLAESARSLMRQILAEAGRTPTPVIFDPSRPATLGDQLVLPEAEPEDRIDIFVERAGLTAARALGQLCIAAARLEFWGGARETTA